MYTPETQVYCKIAMITVCKIIYTCANYTITRL